MFQRKTVSPATLNLLLKLSAIPELIDFNLAGGTALALQIGHRFSHDLDFFGNRPFTTEEILMSVDAHQPLTIISQHKNILILNLAGVKVDFVNYKYLLIGNVVRGDGLRLLSIPDIAAMKLAAIAGRGRKRDFFDLFFLLKQYSLSELIGFYKLKYADGSEMMVARSLTYFDDADEDENPNLFEEVTWPHVKESIAKQVKIKYG